MAEAIISRAGGMNNETFNKIEDMELKDPNYGTVLVTLQNPDGVLAVNDRIKMIDASGNALEYTTNEKGQCLFKTNSGQMNLIDNSFNNQNQAYPIDLLPALNKVIDCPVGSISRVTMNRELASSFKTIGTRNVFFSNSLKNVIVTVSGGGGSSAYPRLIKNGNIEIHWWSSNNEYRVTHSDIRNDARGGSGFINRITLNNIIPYTNYIAQVGGGASFSNTIQERLTFHEPYNGNYMYSHIYSLQSTLNGHQGETSQFGGIISAVGGYGGKWNGNNGINESGGSGSSGSVKGRIGGISLFNRKDDLYNVSLYVNTTQGYISFTFNH